MTAACRSGSGGPPDGLTAVDSARPEFGLQKFQRGFFWVAALGARRIAARFGQHGGIGADPALLRRGQPVRQFIGADRIGRKRDACGLLLADGLPPQWLRSAEIGARYFLS